MSEEALIKSMEKLVAATEKSNSLKQNFLRGALYGFGVFVGGAILVGGLVFLLSHVSIQSDSIFARFINRIVEIVISSKH
jgi:hypothetical protein